MPMESLDDPLKCYTMGNPASSDFSQSSLADSGYGTGSEIPNYYELPTDFDCQGTCRTASDDSTLVQEPQFERINDLVLSPDEEKPIPTYNRRSSRASNRATSDESGVDKRERNRMAASKCRKKQKVANDELQKKERIMNQQHSCLVARRASLESEMICLKNELLRHGTCNNEPISDYLNLSAKKFVQGCDGRTERSETARRG